MASYIEAFLLATVADDAARRLRELTSEMLGATANGRAADRNLADWLAVAIGLAKIPTLFAELSKLNSDSFVSAMRAVMPHCGFRGHPAQHFDVIAHSIPI